MRHLLHPLTLRIWHWINTLLIVVLLFTGGKLRVPDLHLLFDYKGAVVVHRATGYVMAASFLFWLIYAIASGSLAKYYTVRARDLKGFVRQAYYYGFGVFMGSHNPFPATSEEKFNPLQKSAYLAVQLLLTPVIVASGILFANILRFRGAIAFIGGVRLLDAVHLVVAYVFLVYLFVHVYMATMGKSPLTHIREMFTGWEEESDEAH